MRQNKLRALLRSGKPTIGTHLFLNSPTVVETIGETHAFDYVEFLAEYASFDLTALENFCRAAELYDLGTMIKVDNEQHCYTAQRAIGAGFQSILFTDARSPEDVVHFVKSVRADCPSSDGIHGVALRRNVMSDYGAGPAYVTALDDIVIAVMIEKAPAVEALEKVLAVPGIDMIQWGPSDYSMSIGRPGEEDSPAVRTVERRVLETCIQAGIPPRAEISTPEEAKYYLDLGVRHFCIGYDLFTLQSGLGQDGEKLRSLVDQL
jgi:4-hydroxy-2-oxoheptanedioate aldolase